MSKRFPAKVLLFGEHTILRGSRALAIPLRARYAQWTTTGAPARQAELATFVQYLAVHFPGAFAIDRLQADLAAGVYLASNIPTGYGLGSSGAVCVAIFRTYATAYGRECLELEDPKVFLARMERYFHGTSSGTDPLVIYQECPLVLTPEGDWQAVQLPPLPNGWQFFLLDTNHPRETAPLVNYFTERFDDEENFRTKVEEEWVAPNDAAIAALLSGDFVDLWQYFQHISAFQLTSLPPMVLNVVRSPWRAGLDGKHYALKLCGAGGGGFCLGLSRDWTRTQAELPNWELIPVL